MMIARHGRSLAGSLVRLPLLDGLIHEASAILDGTDEIARCAAELYAGTRLDRTGQIMYPTSNPNDAICRASSPERT
jgi:hypothetical protein